ncbi:MAG TPA: carboxypeptidase regulatory-like domain-containing protein [Bryobacteraceae bacterium]|nr:carboxypeptidase regulatory-like domain-containing protein [Bryobacteraceae bacterium]
MLGTRYKWAAAFCAIALFFFIASRASASEVVGTIVLKKNLIKEPVNAGVYDLRGAVTTAKSSKQVHGPFGRVAVWLEPSAPMATAPKQPEMRQAGRRFDPDFLVIPVGSTVDFPNLDPIFHNIFSLSHSKAFDLGYYPEGKSRSVQFSTPGVVQVYCHIHADMYGVIVVTPAAWSAIPAEDGSFSLTGVPPGQYRLAVWQKTNGLTRKKVSVPGTGTVRITVALPEESDD